MGKAVTSKPDNDVAKAEHKTEEQGFGTETLNSELTLGTQYTPPGDVDGSAKNLLRTATTVQRQTKFQSLVRQNNNSNSFAQQLSRSVIKRQPAAPADPAQAGAEALPAVPQGTGAQVDTVAGDENSFAQIKIKPAPGGAQLQQYLNKRQVSHPAQLANQPALHPVATQDQPAKTTPAPAIVPPTTPPAPNKPTATKPATAKFEPVKADLSPHKAATQNQISQALAQVVKTPPKAAPLSAPSLKVNGPDHPAPNAAEGGAAKQVSQAAQAHISQSHALVGNVASGGVTFAESEQAKRNALIAQREAERRTRVAAMVNNFLAVNAGKAQIILNAAQQIPTQVNAAAIGAKAGLMASLAANQVKLKTEFTQNRSRIQSKADTIKNQLESEHTKDKTKIQDDSKKAIQKLSDDTQAVDGEIDSKLTAQLTTIDTKFKHWADQYKQAGKTAGDQAIAKGQEKAGEWRGEKWGHDDNIWDGPLHDDRLEAKAKAAEQTGQGFSNDPQQGFIAQANKGADELDTHKKQFVDASNDIANAGHDAKKKRIKQATDDITKLQQQSEKQLDDAHTGKLKELDTAAQNATKQLDQQEQQATKQLGDDANKASQQIDQQATQIITKGTEQATKSASSLGNILGNFKSVASSVPAPSEQSMAKAIAQAQSQVDTQVSSTTAGIGSMAQQGSQMITQLAAQSNQTAQSLVQSLIQQATQGGDDFEKQANDLLKAAIDAYNQVVTSFNTGLEPISTKALGDIKGIPEAIAKAFEQKVNAGVDDGLQNGLTQLVTALNNTLNGQLLKSIEENADKAASQVAPRWQAIVTFIVVIVVAVALAAVIGPAVAAFLGPIIAGVIGGAGAAGALSGFLTFVIAGAVTGAVSNGAAQVVGNLAYDGMGMATGAQKDVFDGVGQSMLSGAIGGGLGGVGGFGLKYFGLAAKEGMSALATRVAVNTTVNFSTAEIGDVMAGKQITWDSVLSNGIQATLMAGLGEKVVMDKIPGLNKISTAANNFGEKYGNNFAADDGAGWKNWNQTMDAKGKPAAPQSNQSNQQTNSNNQQTNSNNQQGSNNTQNGSNQPANNTQTTQPAGNTQSGTPATSGTVDPAGVTPATTSSDPAVTTPNANNGTVPSGDPQAVPTTTNNTTTPGGDPQAVTPTNNNANGNGGDPATATPTASTSDPTTVTPGTEPAKTPPTQPTDTTAPVETPTNTNTTTTDTPPATTTETPTATGGDNSNAPATTGDNPAASTDKGNPPAINGNDTPTPGSEPTGGDGATKPTGDNAPTTGDKAGPEATTQPADPAAQAQGDTGGATNPTEGTETPAGGGDTTTKPPAKSSNPPAGGPGVEPLDSGPLPTGDNAATSNQNANGHNGDTSNGQTADQSATVDQKPTKDNGLGDPAAQPEPPKPVEFKRDPITSLDDIANAAPGYEGLQDAYKQLKAAGLSQEKMLEILNSFGDKTTVKVWPAGDEQYGIRYYDGTTAKPKGRFLFETFPASRETLALDPRWNEMTGFKQWKIEPGTTIISGEAGPQGPGLPGGKTQFFVSDLNALIEPGPLPSETGGNPTGNSGGDNPTGGPQMDLGNSQTPHNNGPTDEPPPMQSGDIGGGKEPPKTPTPTGPGSEESGEPSNSGPNNDQSNTNSGGDSTNTPTNDGSQATPGNDPQAVAANTDTSSEQATTPPVNDSATANSGAEQPQTSTSNQSLPAQTTDTSGPAESGANTNTTTNTTSATTTEGTNTQTEPKPGFAWESGNPLPEAQQANIDPAKFEKYSMDPNNANNKGKWKAFEELGYDLHSDSGKSQSVQDVINQLKEQLPTTPANAGKNSNFGPRLEVRVKIVGPNGKTGTLVTQWQFDNGGNTGRLITNWLEVHR